MLSSLSVSVIVGVLSDFRDARVARRVDFSGFGWYSVALLGSTLLEVSDKHVAGVRVCSVLSRVVASLLGVGVDVDVLVRRGIASQLDESRWVDVCEYPRQI